MANLTDAEIRKAILDCLENIPDNASFTATEVVQYVLETLSRLVPNPDIVTKGLLYKSICDSMDMFGFTVTEKIAVMPLIMRTYIG